MCFFLGLGFRVYLKNKYLNKSGNYYVAIERNPSHYFYVQYYFTQLSKAKLLHVQSDTIIARTFALVAEERKIVF
jgi:hypothetical protein